MTIRKIGKTNIVRLNDERDVKMTVGGRLFLIITRLEYFSLQWGRQVDFKMATLVYLSLSGMAPAYLAADCQLVSDEGRRQLRAATSRTCVVRRTYSNYGDRCYAAAGLKLWNSLPAELRQTDINFQRLSGY